jgi:hypothetical protein
MESKTEVELLELKFGWKKDPCWDIEETEGFENYKEELLEYRLECEKIWEEKYIDKVSEFGKKNGLTADFKTLEFFMRLENRINKIEESR